MIHIKREQNEICIRIGIEWLAFATENHPRLQDEECESRYRITDINVWMDSVLRAMKDEREDGSTFVTDMLDKAIMEAIEQGFDGTDEVQP